MDLPEHSAAGAMATYHRQQSDADRREHRLEVGEHAKGIETIAQKGGFPDNINDSRLQTAAGLQSLAASITRNATDVYSTASIGDYGSLSQ